MTTRLTAAMAAGVLAVGMLIGAAGAIVIGTPTADVSVDSHHDQMGSMMDVMGAADLGAIMEMMGGSMMGEPRQIGPRSSQHGAHHPGVGR